MNMPTFIEVPVKYESVRAKIWINTDSIDSIVPLANGEVHITVGVSPVQVDLPLEEFTRILRTAGCRLLTRGDIDLIGEPGEEGVK